MNGSAQKLKNKCLITRIFLICLILIFLIVLILNFVLGGGINFSNTDFQGFASTALSFFVIFLFLASILFSIPVLIGIKYKTFKTKYNEVGFCVYFGSIYLLIDGEIADKKPLQRFMNTSMTAELKSGEKLTLEIGAHRSQVTLKVDDKVLY